jgi:glycosyltransferase involved in cell wall biosynthesis
MLDTHPAAPSVSVVVPVFNDVERLRTCLLALAAQTYPADQVEVLVVDNASTQDVAAALPDDPRFRLLHEARRGSYAARNTGLAVATGEVLAFTDADCAPDPTWLEEGVRALAAEPAADMVGGAVEFSYASGAPVSAAELYEFRHGFPQERYLRVEHFAATANMLTWRSVLDRVGPFDARLQSGGDGEFGRRVAAAGGLQRYAERAVVRHPARATTQELLVKLARTSAGTRDAALNDGAGRLFFARLAARQAYLSARTVVAISLLGQPPAALGAKARYLGLYLRLRWLQVRVYGGAALARPRRAASGPAGPSA